MALHHLILEKAKIDKDAQPFWHKTKAPCAILFVHGFADSLWRVNGFANKLKKKYAVKGITLHGHSTKPEDLTVYGPKEWFAQLEEEFIKLKKNHKKVYLVGVSFGGNLILDLAIKYKEDIAGIVLIETPARLNNHEILRFIIKIAKPFKKFYYRNKDLEESEKQKLEKKGIYNKVPLVAAERVLKYIENQRKRLKEVMVPVLITQSKKNDKLSEGNAKYLFNHLGTKDKKIVWLSSKRHTRIDAENKEKIYKQAVFFFKKQNAKHNL